MIHNIDLEKSEIRHGFWKERQELIRRVTIDAVYRQFKDTGRFEAIKLNWKEGMPCKPHIYWESDVTKWIEGAAFFLSQERDPQLEEKIDEIVNDLERAQGPDGYLNEYFTVVEPEARFKRRGDHELYCAGHLIEGAIAYGKATGKTKMLDVAKRYADLIHRVFCIEGSAGFDTPGHEEIELALVKLYLFTSEKRYLELAEYFINERGRGKKDGAYGSFDLEHIQSHLPVREQKTAEGHSVRALYLLCAMADLARLSKDRSLLLSCQTLYENITNKRMYITGGVGSTFRGESFTYDYDLPEYTAYCETCASIALALFCRRMWLIDPKGRYGDTAEQAVYNTVLSGISLSGDKFFYENPISTDAAKWKFNESRPEAMRERLAIPERVKVFTCSCCPPNLIRFVGSVAEYMYSADEDTIYTQCYMDADTEIALKDGIIRLQQRTGYPYSGDVELTIFGEGHFRLAVRIPSWCSGGFVQVNGEQVHNSPADGYVMIERKWSSGDVVEIHLPLETRLISANPRVSEACGRVAVVRGPLVYCAEGIDNGGRPLKDIRIARTAKFWVSDETIDGITVPVLVTDAVCRKPGDELYSCQEPEFEHVELKLIPYFARANRGISEMTTWFLEDNVNTLPLHCR